MIHVGTSGWAYRDRSGRFYPAKLPPARWLEFYTERFSTVELNATTYRLPTRAQVQRWCESVGPGFLYTLKLSRLITHRKMLVPRIDEFIANYMERAACFDAGKLAQILVQFPPYLKRDEPYLAKFLDKLPTRYRYAVEFRHPSWFDPAVEHALRERDMAFCIHDYPGCVTPDVVTTNRLAYMRFHGHTALYAGSYPPDVLAVIARRARALAQRVNDVFIYFNNDVEAAAPHDALALRELLQPA